MRRTPPQNKGKPTPFPSSKSTGTDKAL
jgi:hypothetical protein